MPQSDSVEKIITRYFACLARERFEYAGKEFIPKPLNVSPLLLRGYTCPGGCGGCCPVFTLDYLPSEPRPSGCKPRRIAFNGRSVEIHTISQKDNETRHCRNLDHLTGRCGIYEVRPFSCDFELIRTLEFTNAARPNVLTQKLFGRGWNMLRIDGERGALCEMTPVTEATKADVVRKLLRLEDWADHFGVRTWVHPIIEMIERNRLRTNVILDPSPKRKGFKR